MRWPVLNFGCGVIVAFSVNQVELMLAKLLLAAQFGIAVFFIAKGERANKKDLTRDYGAGRYYYIVGVSIALVFLSSLTVWLLV